MAKRPPQRIDNVKPVTFESFLVSEDGEQLVFVVRGKNDAVGHIAVNWLALSESMHLFQRAGEAAAAARKRLGKSDNFSGSPGSRAQLVDQFQVTEYLGENLKVLSLQTPTGFRCDFAIPTDKRDQLGRPFHQAIADSLLADTASEQKKPQ